MDEIQQGDIWWADLPLPAGRRPVLILTRSSAIPHLTNVTVAPLTRTIRGIRAEALISPADGVPESSAASLDNILTIPVRLLDRRITRVRESTLHDVFRSIRHVFDME